MGNTIKNIVILLVTIVLVIAGVRYLGGNGSSVSAGPETAKRNFPILAPDATAELKNSDPTFAYGLKGEYNFTADLFSNKSPAWEVAMAEFAGKADVQYLEVGVYEGRSVVWMLENILTHPTSHVTGIDIFWSDSAETYEFSPEKQEYYEANLLAAGGEGRFTTLVDFSQIALRELPLEYFDIIYIDGAHNGPAVLEDAVLSWRLLKEGGILIFDDYRWGKGKDKIATPSYAIDIFLETFAGEESFAGDFELLHGERQIILKRVPRQVRKKKVAIPLAG